MCYFCKKNPLFSLLEKLVFNKISFSIQISLFYYLKHRKKDGVQKKENRSSARDSGCHRGASVLYMSQERGQFSHKFFGLFWRGRGQIRYACQKSTWFESYTSWNFAVLASRRRSPAAAYSPDTVPPFFCNFQSSYVEKISCVFLMVVAMRNFSFYQKF